MVQLVLNICFCFGGLSITAVKQQEEGSGTGSRGKLHMEAARVGTGRSNLCVGSNGGGVVCLSESSILHFSL